MTSTWLHYIVEFEDGSRYDVEIDPSQPDAIKVDGVAQAVRVDASQRGMTVSTPDAQRQPLTLFFEHGELIAETSDGHRQVVRVEQKSSRDFRRFVASQPPPAPPEHSGEILAPIAGNVVSLSVAEGGLVEAGGDLLVLEAMKMRNAIAAPLAGTVHFLVQPGQTVRTGDPMARITPTEKKS